jgi:hypothetical protein
MKTAVSRVGAMMAACMMLAAGAALARAAEPVARIPLGPLGYQTMVPEFRLAGSSMLRVDFVDADHLLVTFGLRQLMARLPGDPVDDDDRTVGAVVVELPTGKVLAKTQWRLHDRGQYLWGLGHGRFLLRVRDRLTVIAPMAAGGAKDAFREVPLLNIERHIVALMVSANEDLLTVETTQPAAGAETGEASVGAGPSGNLVIHDPAQTDSAPVQLNFYRLTSTGAGAEGLLATPAGAIRARTAVELPMTTGGFLDVKEGGKDSWLFNFDAHTGPVSELAEWDTTCFPRATFVGHGEYVAFGCRGSAERQALAGFNLKGEEMWQQNFSDQHTSPSFSFAPAAGRFALGRTVVTAAVDESAPMPESVVSAQEVRVVESYDGRVLFKIDCTPVERAGENFALSADGMRLAVVRETLVHHAATKDYDEYTEREAAVEVYALPPLTEKDRAEVKAAEAMAPQGTGARIDLALERISKPVAGDAVSGVSAAGGDSSAQAMVAAAAGAAAGEQGAAATGAEAGAAVEGDAEPGAARKRPTLYGPDEKPAGSSSR